MAAGTTICNSLSGDGSSRGRNLRFIDLDLMHTTIGALGYSAEAARAFKTLRP